MQVREGKISALPSIPHSGIMGLINGYFEHIPNFSWTHPPRQTHDLVRAVVRGLLEGLGGKADKSGEIVLEMPDVQYHVGHLLSDLQEARTRVDALALAVNDRLVALESGRQGQLVDTASSVLEPLVARVAALEAKGEVFPSTLEATPDTDVKELVAKLGASIKALEAEQARQELALKALAGVQKAGRR